MSLLSIFLDIICPSMGVIMATLMFGAPIIDLRRALLAGQLGSLNPFPWAMMTGNCLGWVVYGYYKQHDPFLVAANLPGLILSIWLNSGAAKLQYLQQLDLKRLDQERQSNQEEWDASPGDDTLAASDHNDDDVSRQSSARDGRHEYHPENLVTVPQERLLLRVLCFWSLVLVYVGWIDTHNAAAVVGLVVNLNLIFFYGAPLQTMRAVLREGHSSSIHRPTMYMNWTNTSFWILYGIAKMDPVILVPNIAGLSLGLAQGVLCFFYPKSNAPEDGEHEPLPLTDDDGSSHHLNGGGVGGAGVME